MKAVELLELLSARPFAPLLVNTRDGQSYEIRRPGMAIVTASTVAIGLSRNNGSRLAERIVRCSISDIVNVQPLEKSHP
jgi:hypothetical protein